MFRLFDGRMCARTRTAREYVIGAPHTMYAHVSRVDSFSCCLAWLALLRRTASKRETCALMCMRVCAVVDMRTHPLGVVGFGNVRVLEVFSAIMQLPRIICRDIRSRGLVGTFYPSTKISVCNIFIIILSK